MSGWGASIKTNYSFGRLARSMEKILNTSTDQIGLSAEKHIKENIDKGLRPLARFTKNQRMRGISWGGKKVPPVTHDIPLRQTDALYKSLKYKKETKSIDMMAYGLKHHEGFKNQKGKYVPPRPFLALTTEKPDLFVQGELAGGLRAKVVKIMKKAFKTKMTKNIIK